MSAHPLVSVVVAAYNMRRYVPLAVRSALEGTYPNIEIIVVDDGSTDGVEEEMKQFADEPRVTFHRQPNRGQASAKNEGIRRSKGEFVTYLDADDMWTPDKLEVQLPGFDASPNIGVVYTRYARIGPDGEMIDEPPMAGHSGRITAQLLIENFVSAPLIRRACLDRVGLFDESLPMGIDYDLWLRLSAHYEFGFVDKVTYLYRSWPGQMSRKMDERFTYALFIMNRFLERHPGVVDQRAIDEGWAHTYASWGRALVLSGRPRREALPYFLRALKRRWFYEPAWRGIARMILR